ncbi:redoxin domain-containing protein [Halobellus sp. GM3]|uniref:redoxin domain-containing protein n=1 Tax=Halobellus sp. GM3 TaxID=3458410 RepID=UPI00403D6CFF
MLANGTIAPDFTLPGTSADEDGREIERYQLTDELANGPVLINFYLFDFHPQCTEHLCDLHDLAWFDIDESLTVFGISSDRSFSHRAFAEKEGLGYTLLSDSDGSVAESYDALYEEFKSHRRIAKRSVFLVDTDRVIRYAWSADDPGEQPDWIEIEEALRTIET